MSGVHAFLAAVGLAKGRKQGASKKECAAAVPRGPAPADRAELRTASPSGNLSGVHASACSVKVETDPSRRFVILGRERNNAKARPGTPSGLGYPTRAIREGDLFYIHNFAPDRWPCGDPKLGLKDTDGSPTKSLINELDEEDRFWQMSFGKRPQVELYDLTEDPDCIDNLANDDAYQTKATALREKLFDELKKQGDPRVLGNGDVFDDYDSPRNRRPKQKNTES